MVEGFHRFVKDLEKIYGKFDRSTKKFANKSNSDVARDLFYSDSQFSRLINQTASEGEYVRANKIISRYLENLSLKEKLQKNKSSKSIIHLLLSQPRYLFISILALVGSAYLGYTVKQINSITSIASNRDGSLNDDMLEWAFDKADVKSYTNLDDLPGDCNFPCYRLQGKWQLKDPYKLPVLGDNSGFHYLATDVNMYARCMQEIDSAGNMMEGYEYQKHEIWYDIKRRPMDSFTDPDSESFLSEEYSELNFSQSEDFILVAHVHTFFRNNFYVKENEISREGKVIGRRIEYEMLDQLNENKLNISKEELRDAIENIVDNRLEDFSKPIKCSEAIFEKSSVYNFEDNDEMVYKCKMTTGRLPLGYTKKYILIDQAVRNVCWPE